MFYVLCGFADPITHCCCWKMKKSCWASSLWTALLPWSGSSKPAQLWKTYSNLHRTLTWLYFRWSTGNIPTDFKNNQGSLCFTAILWTMTIPSKQIWVNLKTELLKQKERHQFGSVFLFLFFIIYIFYVSLLFFQIFQIAAHLVYWGKAIIIYPLCENNVYMLSPHANICLWVPLTTYAVCFVTVSWAYLTFSLYTPKL